MRLTPEQAFSHPFISKAVNELKCLKEQPQSNNQSQCQTQPNPNETKSKKMNGKSKSGSKLPTIGKN